MRLQLVTEGVWMLDPGYVDGCKNLVGEFVLKKLFDLVVAEGHENYLTA